MLSKHTLVNLRLKNERRTFRWSKAEWLETRERVAPMPELLPVVSGHSAWVVYVARKEHVDALH